MNSSIAKIDEALLDVRKAYRLLHDYQRMALDAIGYIGKQLDMTYFGGFAKFSDTTPREGKGGLDFWAWDWLNMMEYEFHFTQDIDGGTVLRLSILLISDTGYFCSENETLDQTNVSDFLAPEQSFTEVCFILSGNNWPDTSFMEDKKVMKSFIETRGTLPAEIAAEGIIGKCCNFSRLASEEDTNVLIDELIACANRAGIPLKRLKS